MTTSRNGTSANSGPSSGRKKTVLRGTEGGVAGHNYLLDLPVIVVGRSTRAGLRLTHRGVSRQHARLTNVGGAYYVEDLGSSRGTFVNERAITERTFLANGDTLKVGRVSFTVALVDELSEVEGAVERVSMANVPVITPDPEMADFAEFMLANTSVSSTLPEANSDNDLDDDEDDGEDDDGEDDEP